MVKALIMKRCWKPWGWTGDQCGVSDTALGWNIHHLTFFTWQDIIIIIINWVYAGQIVWELYWVMSWVGNGVDTDLVFGTQCLGGLWCILGKVGRIKFMGLQAEFSREQGNGMESQNLLLFLIFTHHFQREFWHLTAPYLWSGGCTKVIWRLSWGYLRAWQR